MLTTSYAVTNPSATPGLSNNRRLDLAWHFTVFGPTLKRGSIFPGYPLNMLPDWVRYEVLSHLQQQLGASRIALGHTADDQAETLMLRLVRGSGPGGLAGIGAVRLPYIRPLITMHRKNLTSYLQQECIPWVEDGSNRERIYFRNQVRHDVLPVLRSVNPRIDSHLNELAEMLGAEQQVIEQLVDDLYAQVVCQTAGQRLHLQGCPYRAAPVALQRRLLRRVLDHNLPVGSLAGFNHIERLRHLVAQGRVGERLTLPGRWIAERHVHDTTLWRVSTRSDSVSPFILPVPGRVDLPVCNTFITADVFPRDDRSSLPEIESGGHHTAYLDCSALKAPLYIRFRQAGDRFHPLGAPGQKKLKAYLIDKKVPRWKRDAVPLVLNDRDIVWVAGYQLAEAVKIRPETSWVVRLRHLQQKSKPI